MFLTLPPAFFVAKRTKKVNRDEEEQSDDAVAADDADDDDDGAVDVRVLMAVVLRVAAVQCMYVWVRAVYLSNMMI